MNHTDFGFLIWPYNVNMSIYRVYIWTRTAIFFFNFCVEHLPVNEIFLEEIPDFLYNLEHAVLVYGMDMFT